MSSENTESTASPNDNALFLHVKYKCKTTESVEAVTSCLKSFVEFQLEHPYPGVLLYNFSHPDPEGQPLMMQFFELYKDAKVFFDHSDSPTFFQRYSETFVPPEKNTESAKTYAYGRPATDNAAVKGVLCEYLHASLPDTVAGYLLPDDPANVLAADHADAVLMICEVTIKSSDSDAVVNHFKSISNSSDNNALTFHVGNIEKNADTSQYDVTAVYVNNSDLLKHLNAVKETFQTIHKLSSAFRFQLMGDVSQSSKSEIKNFGFPVSYGTPDAGYALHPIAEQAFQS